MQQNDNKIFNILFVARDDGGCGFYRCIQPAKFIKRMGLAETDVVFNSPSEEQLRWADLVIMQEMGSVSAMNIVKFLLENKIPYVSEIDDFLHHVSPNNTAGFGAWNPSTLYVQRSMNQIRQGLALTVSTEWLAREYFPYHQNIFVIPNYLDQDKWVNPSAKMRDEKIRIGWAGGNAHKDDLFMVSGVIEKIVKESNGKVVFETMGMTERELSGVFNLEKFADTCSNCNHSGQIRHHAPEAYENYPLVLAGKGWDIAIAPVIDNSFGNAKSDLKIKEYSACGIPVVASNVAPYRGALASGASIALATTFDEWYTAIKYYIKNKERRIEAARHNKKWVEQYWIQENAQKTFEIYKNLINAFYGQRKI